MANLDELLKKFDLEKSSTKLTTNERMRKEIKGYITDPKQFEKGLLAIAELSREQWTLSVELKEDGTFEISKKYPPQTEKDKKILKGMLG